MKIVFSELAKQELDDAYEYYEGELDGLGLRFDDEVLKAAQRISDYPRAWSVERGEVRRCLLHSFPYKLLYSIEEDHVLIIAVAHQRRRPGYWIDR